MIWNLFSKKKDNIYENNLITFENTKKKVQNSAFATQNKSVFVHNDKEGKKLEKNRNHFLLFKFKDLNRNLKEEK